MPFVNVRTAQGLLDDTQRAQLHAALTDVMVQIEGRGDPAFRRYVTVLIEEQPAQGWSVAGQPLTADAIGQLAGTNRR